MGADEEQDGAAPSSGGDPFEGADFDAGGTDTISLSGLPTASVVSAGETLQHVRFVRDAARLLISGVTPHGRRLTFEHLKDGKGWSVLVAGRRRRPTERELALVVASITQEMEAAMAPDGQSEVRSAYRLAAASEQPNMPLRGLQAFHDVLLDSAEAFVSGQFRRLVVVAIEYQAFKRFANRHGHRIGEAFVRSLGERLHHLFDGHAHVEAFHKAGKSFRLVATDMTVDQAKEAVQELLSPESRAWLVHRAWGDAPRTHPDEVHFYIGIAGARRRERGTAPADALAQRLNDDAYRAAKLGQLRGHSALYWAKLDYRTSIEVWQSDSVEEFEALASSMDDGPAAVWAETSDYLHELSPVDLEGMSVAGDVRALVYQAIARDGFWQGTTAMRIAGERLLGYFMNADTPPAGEYPFVGGFDLGDEFYGMVVEDDEFRFLWGDVNSAGATRLRAGLRKVQDAVGWKRADEGGLLGRILRALPPSEAPLLRRVCDAADIAYTFLARDPALHVPDAVDIAEFLVGDDDLPVTAEALQVGAQLSLVLPDESYSVEVAERRSRFSLKLVIDNKPRWAVLYDGPAGLHVKLRLRDTVVSAAACILRTSRESLLRLLAEVREERGLPLDAHLDVLGFLRHVADILLLSEIKGPEKVAMALGRPYSAQRFVRSYALEEVRAQYPGLFFEALNQSLLADSGLRVDPNLADLVGETMLSVLRPRSTPAADAFGDAS